jgi:hypothetical protein
MRLAMTPPKLVPALLGGLFMGVLSALPFVNLANCCCLWVVAGGLVAAWVMQQNHPWPVTLGDGAAVGLLAGVVGAALAVVLMIPVNLYLGFMMEEWSRGVFPWRQRMPPEAEEVFRQFGRGVIYSVVGSLMFIVTLVFSTLGGLVGAALFRKAEGAPQP